jgi:hypothetical protein
LLKRRLFMSTGLAIGLIIGVSIIVGLTAAAITF